MSSPPSFPERYEDLGPLAQGGMGEVRRVRDRRLGSVLAMKILRSDADQAELRERFLREAQITARLSHPGIVAVQDVGALADGRPWYTMDFVQGRTLQSIIDELHAAAGAGGWQPVASGWTLRRVVEAFAQACRVVAYAHAQGVLHRDLKPENLMVGAFGEVRVMDWGLARLAGTEEPAIGVDLIGEKGTSAGRVLGTPAYMPPEQARGEAVDARADVYALGAILYTLLCGVPPYPGPSRQAWRALLRGPPPFVDEVCLDRDVPPPPFPLQELCMEAMARDREQRLPDALQVVAELTGWLEGARRRTEARKQVARAEALRPQIQAASAEAAALALQAAVRLRGVPPHAPIEKKLPGWRLEEQAEARQQEVRRLEASFVRRIQAALVQDPDDWQTHALAASFYRERLLAAEARGDKAGTIQAEAGLQSHDRGQHAAWLRGDGAVTVVTDPPGARVRALRFVAQDRRQVEVMDRELGTTPLHGCPLPRGSWLLLLEHPDRAPVRYPVYLRRAEHWDGIPPGEQAPRPIRLPRRAPPGACLVPAGWFHSGGDPHAPDGLSARRLWVEGLWVQQHPVTHGAYCDFLNASPDRPDAWLPGLLDGAQPLYREETDGRLALDRWPDGAPVLPTEPVVSVPYAAAVAFAAWASTPTLRWRLPHSQEHEKAARGVDGRAFPWGDDLDPTWCRMAQSAPSHAGRVPVGAYPLDRSVYGIIGLAGNVRDWCATPYSREGLPDGAAVRPAPLPADAPWAMVRGGTWAASADFCRAAGRYVWRPGRSINTLGFRLVAQQG